MNVFDQKLLADLQSGFPLVREPFAEMARRCGWDESAVIARVEALRREGVIREISGIFDAQTLGYRQTLAAFSVPENCLDDAGRIVAGHPGVTHCYSRSGQYNLWFTLAVSPQSTLGLDGTIRRLAELSKATKSMILPTLRRYKLQVRFGEDVAQATPCCSVAGILPARVADVPSAKTCDKNDTCNVESLSPNSPAASAAPMLSDSQLRAIRALQADLPAQADPFAPLAAAGGMTVDELLAHAAEFQAAGMMRRYAAVLHHRSAGATTNVLAAWAVAESAADAAGAAASGVAEVSHCYLRPVGDDWPFNLYTMIHGHRREDCQTVIQKIQTLTGLSNHAELWTLTEYKKRRMILFGNDEAKWERTNQP
ncbi:MAG: Lrp/AsnC family transcriptional regulator [Planctomycetaceae bacterium]|nr:MAG: Lrp/AsnC family transcriptional regulator [Planctomycetaceae bacterium]